MSVFTAKAAARELRKQLYKGSRKTDIKKVAKHLGVRVIEQALPDDTSGVLVVDKGVPTVIVNASEGPYRQKFTIAHELGHFYMHKPTGIHVDKKSAWAYRNESSKLGTDMIEVEANQFAAEILMPEEVIGGYQKKHKITDFDDSMIEGLAKYLGVSFTAMTIRLTSLRLLKASF